MIALNAPLKPDLDKLAGYLKGVNELGWYTNFGPLHELLTKRLENYLGVENLLLVSNGTLAIQVACKALNVNSAITTPFSFVATTSSLLWQGMEVGFSDIDKNSYNLCPIALENSLKQSTKNYDCIVATHVYGNPCDVEGLERVTHKYQKKLIYDAAHAFSVSLNERSVLSFGDASTLSFHATKVFHTIEGGAIVFKNRSDFLCAKQLINFGIQEDGSLGIAGINAKLNEYQCAVGLVLLDMIDEVIEHRSSLFKSYETGLEDIVSIPQWHPEASHNGAYFPIYIKDEYLQDRLLETLNSNHIQCRRYFTPSLDLAFSETDNFGSPVSREIAGGVICLPLHYYLTIEDVEFVIKIIKQALRG